MKTIFLVLGAATISLSAFFVTPTSQAIETLEVASPVYGVAIPRGYRQWELVAPALEAEPLNEIRAVLGNAVPMAAYRDGSLPFPDGTVLVKLPWRRSQSTEFESATVPGAATSVNVMVKDTSKYAETGARGGGRLVNGIPTDEAQHRTCFACHAAGVRKHDFVFTRFAP